MRTAFEFFGHNLDRRIALGDAVRAAGLSPKRLIAVFRRLHGVTPRGARLAWRARVNEYPNGGAATTLNAHNP